MERISDEDYNAKVKRLSDASARIINTPYEFKRNSFIDWDSPELAVTPDDDRWMMPEEFDIGSHEWYQELPRDRKISIGMWRYANVARVGLEFEHVLNAGIGIRNQVLPSDSVEHRYTTHEAEEENRHILMFNEMINRIGVDPHGSPDWFRNISPAAGYVARKMPVGFWALVLAGEEPIDHTQQRLIDLADNGTPVHPMVYNVMRKHREEEARHINFADKFLKKHIQDLSPAQKKLFETTLPFMLKAGAYAILKPKKEALDAMEIPHKVADEVWFNSELGRATLRGLFEDFGNRADQLGIRNGDPKTGAPASKLGQWAWKKAGLVTN